MNTLACFVHRVLFLGTVVYITASANLMMEYNWPTPDSNINRFPHESSCHYYYLMLSEEDISIEKCPDGQLFDYTKHNCISDREHIHCWSRQLAKIIHGHMHIKHKKHFKCPYPWGKYPNLHDCRKYHLCLNGKSRVKKCAPYELFDKISRKCIAAIDAVCGDKTDVVEHGYVCPKTWGSFTYLKDCSKYYECLQRKPSLRTCKKGYLFDDRLAKCAPKEHVYCGLRQNPYEKVSSDSPQTQSVPISTSNQKSTTRSDDVTTIAVDKITPVKPISQETESLPQEASSTQKEITSLPQESSSTLKEMTSLPPEISSTIKEMTSLPQQSSTLKEMTSLPQEPSSTLKEITSLPQEISSTFREIASSTAEGPQNQPVHGEILTPSAIPETDKNEIKPKNNIATAGPDLENLKEKKETSVVTEEVSGKKEFPEVSTTTEKEPVVIPSQTAFSDGLEVLKKDVSTEEKGELASKASIDSSSKSGCLLEDAMCITEKDGTVVKCSTNKDLQPHPKDERRFVDCTGAEIKIYTCPPNLTFHRDSKKCKWQFLM